MNFFLTILFFYRMCGGEALRNIYPTYETTPIDDDNVGIPVFLTEFINSGNIEAGRVAASVKPVKGNISSYAGLFTVDPKYNSSMFFWYFVAEKNASNAPVVVWLQGGPGASSLYGLFEENGPFYVKPKRGLKLRDYYWSQLLHVIYIDNPVGTGYSFTDDDAGYARTEEDVGRNLYSAVSQFFKVFPNLQNNDFYVTGESYAGKYVPSLAYTIHKNNKDPNIKQKINMKGLAIGNGLCDPENMMNYSDYLYQIGLIDSNTRLSFQRKQQEIVANIKQKNYIKAFEGFDLLLNGDLTPYKSLFYNQTGFSFYFNFLHNRNYSPHGDMGTYIQKSIMRRSIHVGNLTFHTDNKVEKFLENDIMQSIKPYMEVLIDNYRVLIYNGQLDIIVPYPLTVNFLQTLNWSGAKQYKIARRKQWFVGPELAGYAKTVKTFTEVLVRDAGHMVPADQPLWALDLITRFTFGKSF